LLHGERVYVRREANNPGWLAITPPVGSFSWIPESALEIIDKYTGLVRPGVPIKIRAGSSVHDREPDVETAELPPGTLVTVLDGSVTGKDGSKWLPIKAHLSEVRYIPADAIKQRDAGQWQRTYGVAGAPARPKSWVSPGRETSVSRGSKVVKVYDVTGLLDPDSAERSKLELKAALSLAVPDVEKGQTVADVPWIAFLTREQRMVVRHTLEVHQQIDRVLADLRASISTSKR
jgi:hypothetical protein